MAEPKIEQEFCGGVEELKSLYIQKHKELETLKKSLQTLAVTIVRQDKHIKTLSSYISGARENYKQQQQDSNPSAGYTNSYTDTQDDEEIVQEYEHSSLTDTLRHQMQQTSDFLHQVDTDSYTSEPFPARSNSPYLQHQQLLFQGGYKYQSTRSSTPQSQPSSMGRQTPKNSRSIQNGNNGLQYSRQEGQRDSVYSNMTRVHPINRPSDSHTSGRSQTPTRRSAESSQEMNSGIINRRPRSVINLREEQDEQEQYFDTRHVALRSNTPTDYHRSIVRQQYVPQRSSTLVENRSQRRIVGEVGRRSSTPTHELGSRMNRPHFESNTRIPDRSFRRRI